MLCVTELSRKRGSRGDPSGVEGYRQAGPFENSCVLGQMHQIANILMELCSCPENYGARGGLDRYMDTRCSPTLSFSRGRSLSLGRSNRSWAMGLQVCAGCRSTACRRRRSDASEQAIARKRRSGARVRGTFARHTTSFARAPDRSQSSSRLLVLPNHLDGMARPYCCNCHCSA